MAANTLHEELTHQLSAIGAVQRELGRIVPAGCSDGSATVLTLLSRQNTVSIRELTALLGIDISVTSRHVAHLAMLGWADRRPDPADRRSRLVRLTDTGRARFAELSERRSRELAARLRDWSDEDIRRLALLLSRLRTGFDSSWTGRCTRAESSAADTPVV
ncbi:MarR family transcriptional regulator [Streptomyces pseudogriseolus]|uniref:MarR family transcriptional regulator n=1 Tax=Streptomyces sp. R17 TaxID=3238626 RepID=A0AB39NYZ7_9ACTN|nr:MarR family transcriptional regulator [Streptomyces pseudogriseolus]